MKLETERLFIHPASEQEMRTFIAAQNDEILRMAYQEMLDGCTMHPQQWEWYAIWFIELKDGTHIGELCFKGVDADGVSEIGYGIREEFHGMGYATEAVGAATKWAFEQRETTAITAETDAENAASIRVLQKCGFRSQGLYGTEGPVYILQKQSK